MVASGKANLSRPLAIAEGLAIPAFVVFDVDSNKPEDSNKKNNQCLFGLCGIDIKDPLPTETVWGDNVIAWPLTMKHAVVADVGEDKWTKADKEVQGKYAYEGIGQKNQLVIAAILEELWHLGIRSATLQKTCQSIVRYAEKAK